MPDRALLVAELDRFARKLITDYPVSDALHDLVDATVCIFDLRGAGASLARDHRLEFATATPADINAVEMVQEQLQTGPCVDAWRTGTAVLVADLAEEPRWGELSSVASRSGIHAVAAVPLVLSDTRLGALSLYDDRVREWTPEDVHTADLLAALASGYIANAARLDRVRQTAEQLQEALDSRVVIEQAKGVLAGERKISIDQAFHVLRAHARSHGAPLREVASAVVNLGLRP